MHAHAKPVRATVNTYNSYNIKVHSCVMLQLKHLLHTYFSREIVLTDNPTNGARLFVLLACTKDAVLYSAEEQYKYSVVSCDMH